MGEIPSEDSSAQMSGAEGSQQMPAAGDAYFVGWCDETLNADCYFRLLDVSATDAALLLCEFNPAEHTVEAGRLAGGVVGTHDPAKLILEFEDLARAVPKRRALVQWLQEARARGLPYNDWIDRYVIITRPVGAEGTEAPSERQDRRLARLRELGGEARKAGEDAWQFSAGRRGALARLIREESDAGRPMAKAADVRRDLARAAEREMKGNL